MPNRSLGGSGSPNRRASAIVFIAAMTMLAATTAADAAQRFVGPTGSGATCSQAAPCSLPTGITGAAFEDEVILESGTYSVATGIATPTGGLFIHGEAGRPRPVIVSPASTAIELNGVNIRISDLSLQHTGSAYGLFVFSDGSRVDHVQVSSTGSLAACYVGPSVTFRDSLCVATGNGAKAVQHEFTLATGSSKVRNVTAIATGTSSVGMRFAVGPGTVSMIDARNVIAQGELRDVQSVTMGAGSTMSVALQSANYDTASTSGAGATLTVPGTGTNQLAPPLFSDLTLYRQAPGSPTIDAGAVDADTGATDLEGDARPLGATIDIGADELDPGPAPAVDFSAPDTEIEGGPKRRSKARKATFSFSSDEAGATFECRLDRSGYAPCATPLRTQKLSKKSHTFSVQAIDSAGNRDASPASFKWKVTKRKTRPRG